MDHKHTYAKKRVKRSAVFTTGIGGAMIVGGLGVSLPIYFKIQEQLKKSYSDVVDLTIHLQELTNKLGIDPDEEFVKELSNGYVIAFSSGKTKIYRKNDSSNAIIINSNEDGTMGSAGTLAGAAARGMLNVLHDVKNEFKREEKTIEEILEPFVNDVEEKSIQIESAIIGLTPNEIKSRNALANNDSQAAMKAFSKVQEEIRIAGEKEVSLEKMRDIVATNRKEFRKNNNVDIKNKITQLKEKLRRAGSKLRKVYVKRIIEFYKTWNGKIIVSNMEEQSIKTWNNVREYYNAKNIKDLTSKLKTLDSETLGKIAGSINEITTIIFTQVKVENIKNKKEMENNRPSIFSKLTSTPVKLLTVLSNSLGYEGNEDDPVDGKSRDGSTTIINKLKSYAIRRKYHAEDFDDIVKELKRIGNWNSSTNKSRNRIKVKKIIDTSAFDHPLYKNWIIVSVTGNSFNNQSNNKSIYMLFNVKKGEMHKYEKTSNESTILSKKIIKDYLLNAVKKYRVEDLSIIFNSIKSMDKYRRLAEKLKLLEKLNDKDINRNIISNEINVIKNKIERHQNNISSVLLFNSITKKYKINAFNNNLLQKYLNDEYVLGHTLNEEYLEKIFKMSGELDIVWNKNYLIKLLSSKSTKLIHKINSVLKFTEWIEGIDKVTRSGIGNALLKKSFEKPNDIQKIINNLSKNKPLIKIVEFIKEESSSSDDNEIFDYMTHSSNIAIDSNTISLYKWINSISNVSLRSTTAKLLRNTIKNGTLEKQLFHSDSIDIMKYMYSVRNKIVRYSDRFIEGIQKLIEGHEVPKNFLDKLKDNLKFRDEILSEIERVSDNLDTSSELNEKITKDISNLSLRYPNWINVRAATLIYGKFRKLVYRENLAQHYKEKLVKIFYTPSPTTEYEQFDKITDEISNFMDTIYEGYTNEGEKWDTSQLLKFINVNLALFTNWDFLIKYDEDLKRASGYVFRNNHYDILVLAEMIQKMKFE